MIFSGYKKRAASLIKSGTLVQAVLILVGGALLAHLVTAISLPILTRVYAPEEFDILAAFSSVLMIVTVVACLRFDIAIPMAKNDEEAFSLFLLSLISCFSVVLLTIFLIFIFSTIDSFPRDLIPFWSYIWFLPLGVFLFGFFSALQGWYLRNKDFKLLAKGKILQSCAASGSQVASGFLGFGVVGLLLGPIFNFLFGSAFLFFKSYPRLRRSFGDVGFFHLKKVFCLYKDFPRYSVGEALTNSAALQLPLLIISVSSKNAEAGYIFLAMAVIQAPMALLGTSVAQAYVSKAAEEFKNNNLKDFTQVVLGGLMKTGVGPLIALGFCAPAVFSLVFGAEWMRAGVLVSWMTPWFVCQFLVSPVSMALNITGNQRLALILQVLGFVGRVVPIVLLVMYAEGRYLGEVFAVTGLFFYFVYMIVVLRVVGSNAWWFAKLIKDNFLIVFSWVLIGFFVKYLFSFLF